MSRKISRSLVSGRAGVGIGGQGLKIEWGSNEPGRLHWMDVYESSLEPVWYGGRGVFMQNSNGNTYGKDNIQYITISSTGNATDFGNIIMTSASVPQGGNCCSNGSRGILFGGGYPAINQIQYITVSTPGNATDFGDMVQNNYNGGALSNGLRGIHGGGDGVDEYVDIIEYITIDTTGNATDFGDLLDAVGAGLAGICNGTRGLFGGKIATSEYGIQYITVATTGDAADFGDLTVTRYSISGVDDATRGVFSAGRSAGYVNTMDYITMASTGNATDFGDLDRAVKSTASADNHSRGIFAGGHSGSDEISYITIQTTGNSTDFGNCLENTAASGLSGD